MSGILTVFNKTNPAVSNYGAQTPPEDIGVEPLSSGARNAAPAARTCPRYSRRHRFVWRENIRNGVNRPTHQPNIWLAEKQDTDPQLTLTWKKKQTIREIELVFDTDFDHPMENVIYHHPERAMHSV